MFHTNILPKYQKMFSRLEQKLDATELNKQRNIKVTETENRNNYQTVKIFRVISRGKQME